MLKLYAKNDDQSMIHLVMKDLSMKSLIITLSVFFVSCAHHNHLKKSNMIGEQFTKEFSKTSPELGSSLGYKEFDRFGSNPSKEKEKKELALLDKWDAKLKNLIAETENKNLKVDYLVLHEKVKMFKEQYNINKKLSYIDIPHATRSVYYSLFTLINPQSPKERKLAAVDRFNDYMSEKGKLNYIAALKSEIKRNLKENPGPKTYPYIGELKKYLEDSPTLVKGIEKLLAMSGRDDWKSSYQLFKKEIKDYNNYVKKTFLTKARKSASLPREMYLLQLKNMGNELSPEQLIRDGKKDFEKLYKEYEKVAKRIAKKNNLKKDSPYAIIKFLKTKQVTKLEDVIKLYNDSSDRLEEIIRKNNLVSLPKRKLKIRFAGDAESKAQPVPHLNPPPLIDNDGIVPEFVVPTASDGKLAFDDFTYQAAAMILTAHEGRPGHDLQFSRMLENETSLIRARYAMNSVNVEGWGLYAEDLVYPYLTDEQKMSALQLRLMRIARYFLDPMVQTNLVGQKDVINTFHYRLGISKAFAGLEYQRYAFRAPGQAPSYYRGLLNIRKFKKSLMASLGALNEKCFNDTLISFGLLPHNYISEFRDEFQKCRK